MVAPKAFLDPDPDFDPDTLLPWFEPGQPLSSVWAIYPWCRRSEVELVFALHEINNATALETIA